MQSTSTLADAIGRKRMAASLGVGKQAVSNAVVRGSFPPSWFLVVRALAKGQGVDCPPQLFGMKETGAGDPSPEREPAPSQAPADPTIGQVSQHRQALEAAGEDHHTPAPVAEDAA